MQVYNDIRVDYVSAIFKNSRNINLYSDAPEEHLTDLFMLRAVREFFITGKTSLMN